MAGEVVAFGVGLSELGQLSRSLNRALVGKDIVAIIVAEFLAPGLEPAGVDRRIEAPVVERKREIVADPGNVVLVCSFFEQRVGIGAVRALHVCKFDDGHACAGGRAQG